MNMLYYEKLWKAFVWVALDDVCWVFWAKAKNLEDIVADSEKQACQAALGLRSAP